MNDISWMKCLLITVIVGAAGGFIYEAAKILFKMKDNKDGFWRP